MPFKVAVTSYLVLCSCRKQLLAGCPTVGTWFTVRRVVPVRKYQYGYQTVRTSTAVCI